MTDKFHVRVTGRKFSAFLISARTRSEMADRKSSRPNRVLAERYLRADALILSHTSRSRDFVKARNKGEHQVDADVIALEQIFLNACRGRTRVPSTL